MKKIYIDPETWGPDYLWHPAIHVRWNNDDTEFTKPSMCCLGFACYQLGASKQELQCEGLPSVFVEMRDTPDDVLKFAQKCLRVISAELAVAANKLMQLDELINTRWDYESTLSRVNDWYHNSAGANKDKLEPTLEVLKLGFKEMGYELVYGKAPE